MTEMNKEFTKWVACWGNATSITDRTEAVYAKDITLRYPIRMCFDGSSLRFHFSNLTGTEPITVTKAFVCDSDGEKCVTAGASRRILFGGAESVTIAPGEEVCSDEVSMDVRAGQDVAVSLYFADYTQMNAGVLITGPLSKGYYSYGDYAEAAELPMDLTRKTKWFYFLNTIDVLTEEKNHALICYGDSITAQSWPDYLSIRAWEEGFRNVSIIRRAVSGTRILREYSCITYAAYGLKGEKRFCRETVVAGADAVLIQHGINDIIHPVGEEVNPFRPWSDLPSVEDMIEGVKKLYLEPAKAQGLKVYAGTLLPIYGWRTYAPFREDLKEAFNAWLRSEAAFDGCVDFDAAVRDKEDARRFAEGFDSGDHLHPSEAAYKAMAAAVPEEMLR